LLHVIIKNDKLSNFPAHELNLNFKCATIRCMIYEFGANLQNAIFCNFSTFKSPTRTLLADDASHKCQLLTGAVGDCRMNKTVGGF